MDAYEKRGYLNSEFRLFHLTDTKHQDFDYHYHDFDKVIIFINGNVEYTIEGRTYQLRPYDIVLVNHNHIHYPSIDHSIPYERIIVYLSPSFITSFRTDTYDLSQCFQKAEEEHAHVLRVQSLKQSTLFQVITSLEQACGEEGYAHELYCQVLFLEFMIQLNRGAIAKHVEYMKTTSGNPKVASMIDYINQHLTEPLSIEHLSSRFYLSRYHLMHLFKDETSYSLASYIQSKRLMLAKELLVNQENHLPITQICFDCGFHNYSTFSRAYHKQFGESPRESRAKH